ncbi:hypothetical protein [Domibacillus epiphyticus]|nr:hypothetical protein [Domibacillus epiphyticus]
MNCWMNVQSMKQAGFDALLKHWKVNVNLPFVNIKKSSLRAVFF